MITVLYREDDRFIMTPELYVGKTMVQPRENEVFECPWTFWRFFCACDDYFRGVLWKNCGCYNESTDLAQFQRDYEAYYLSDGLPPFRPAMSVIREREDLARQNVGMKSLASGGMQHLLRSCPGVLLASHIILMEFDPVNAGIFKEKVRQIRSSLTKDEYNFVHALWPHHTALQQSEQAITTYHQRYYEKYRSDPPNISKLCWERDRETHRRHRTNTAEGSWKQVHIFDGEGDSQTSSTLTTVLDDLAIFY
jgi:hypothetical protein